MLIYKFHEARQATAGEVMIWGTGTPRREFLHADAFADAGVLPRPTRGSSRMKSLSKDEPQLSEAAFSLGAPQSICRRNAQRLHHF